MPLKWLALVAISAAFVWIGFRILGMHALAGWSCVVFFGLCGAIGALHLLPGASQLSIDDDGFEIRTLFRSTRVRWADVARFGTMRIGMQRMVGFDLVDGYRGSERLRRVNRGLSGYQAALPDTYGLRADALAERMAARLAGYRQESAAR